MGEETTDVEFLRLGIIYLAAFENLVTVAKRDRNKNVELKFVWFFFANYIGLLGTNFIYLFLSFKL